MKRRSVLASMGAFTASGSLVMGSGAFTSAEVERNVTVTVVEDENAYVGLKYLRDVTVEANGSNNQSENVARITNQFTTSVTVTLETDGPLEYQLNEDESDEEVGGGDNSAEIPTGTDAVFDAGVDCDQLDAGEPTVTITANGTGVYGELDRNVDVECTSPAVDNLGVRFTGGGGQGGGGVGSGNVQLEGEYTESLDMVIWRWGGENATSEPLRLNPDEKLQDKLSGSGFIAVFIEQTNKTYLHPNLTKEDEGLTTPTGKGSNAATDCVRECELDLNDLPADFDSC